MFCAALGKFDETSRYGQLALDLLKKFRSKEYAPRVFAIVYGNFLFCDPAWFMLHAMMLLLILLL
jgi:predicted ATPase